MDYKPILSKLLNAFKKNELQTFHSIRFFDCVKLASKGNNDIEGYQIFTPEFIVRNMCEAIGEDLVDFTKNILEPTSGDGAFTSYIFLKRLEVASRSKNFELDSFRALSTIYSIEMDEELMVKQRNNILTTAAVFIKGHNISVNDGYFDVLKCIITKNFIWAMFNEDQNTQSMAAFNCEKDIAFAMPNAERNKKNDNYLLMPVWTISTDSIDFHEEGVELPW